VIFLIFFTLLDLVLYPNSLSGLRKAEKPDPIGKVKSMGT